MKEKETKMLYHSISNINEDFIEEARKAKTKKVKRPAWIQWGMAAACILLVAAAVYGVTDLFTVTSENDSYPDTGPEDASLDGNPDGYSQGPEKQPDDHTETAEQGSGAQDPAGQKTETAGKRRSVISAYGDMESSACYKAPDNDACMYSVPLQKAMEKYGDSVIYKIVVDVFSDNKMFEADSEAVKNEIERLDGLDYKAGLEQYHDENGDHCYFILVAEQKQIVNFVKKDHYGYMFWLFDERAK